ncbi:glycerophosphodiester phosphodiesterase [Paenibacillus montanisoli]|uniref:Glycerophosphodiester phosphodiesterase n=1 Tax=Paenibacillus montanisoli TaxID=2081970 RepID=A0A328TXL1_9BACL|nr:glycerophosphodiester phosphodiesterase family protein [Paenibacillus montanisoli]RAP75180.1 glycerophosphodiester phosphodiesterase [Paenibacillus montanisoli]
MITIVAHRGWSGAAPENTMAAFALALKEPGIHFIELDVHLSKDGVPVVIHDHTLDRTTNGTGPVESYTYEQLRELDAGSWFGPAFEGQKIPSLEEVFELTKGRCKLAVELKTMGGNYEGIERKVLALIEQREMKDQVVLSSFDHDSMKRAHEIDPSVMTGLILFGKPTLIWEQLTYTGASSISIHHEFVTDELMKEMYARGIDIGVWTVDEPEKLARIAAQYPDMRITTNHPDRLLSITRQQPAVR